MKTLTDLIDKLLQLLLIVLSTTIVACVTWQVFARYVLQSPSSVTEELARFLLIWIGLFGAAYAYRMGSHLGLDILTNRMKPVNKRAADLFSNLTVLFFAAYVMVLGGISLVALTMDPSQISASLEIKMGYIYSAVPISGGLISLFAIEKIYMRLTQPINTAEC
ncbi:TRAP transporter small permease [Catenovulum adriaticum]|uniref:TRAP transporter small permease protein n=1 Tax=Catenovulum adriaticum TaxID=2984846 RepID=A0ABY7ARV6_9ALTE|nr:TRAP transporter small permease [Catenovulum sp. TS8]WAJ72268.1 TRAP transporter small permease [Catenovulum sp. TS8]